MRRRIAPAPFDNRERSAFYRLLFLRFSSPLSIIGERRFNGGECGRLARYSTVERPYGQPKNDDHDGAGSNGYANGTYAMNGDLR